jgi:hypothetical protein
LLISHSFGERSSVGAFAMARHGELIGGPGTTTQRQRFGRENRIFA